MKDLLVCSNFCEFSKIILTEIQKRNVRNKFAIMFVDNARVPIPKEVDRVPALITRTGTLLFGEDVIKYIETFCCSDNNVSHRSSSITHKEDIDNSSIAPFSLQSQLNSYSESYTFLDDSAQDHRVGGFGFIGQDHEITGISQINTRQDRGDAKKSKLDEAYEKYVSDRDADMKQLTRSSRPI